MKICPKCGTENTNNSSYCIQCGKSLDREDKSNKETNKILNTVIIAEGVLILAFMIGGIVYLLGKDSGSDTPGSTATSALSEHAEGPEGGSSAGAGMTSDIGDTSDVGSTSEEGATKKEIIYVLPKVYPDQFYVYEGHTYGFYNAATLDLPKYWQVSRFCRDQGGHLATINDKKENDYLFGILRSHYDNTAFFGYSDADKEGTWQWDNEECSYSNWTKNSYQNQPDNGVNYGTEEDYAEFNYDGNKPTSEKIPNDGTWNDAPFRRNTDLFICEWEYDVVEALNNG